MYKFALKSRSDIPFLAALQARLAYQSCNLERLERERWERERWGTVERWGTGTLWNGERWGTGNGEWLLERQSCWNRNGWERGTVMERERHVVPWNEER